jgi:hypothetical protein
MGWYMDESSRKLGISKTDAEAQYLAYHEGRTGYANQSYLGKPWLVEVAARVQSRSENVRRTAGLLPVGPLRTSFLRKLGGRASFRRKLVVGSIPAR